jgi:hypothetical protein
MSERFDELARRRAQLVDRVNRDRSGLADEFDALHRRMRVAEVLVGVARHASRQKTLTGAIAVLSIVAPFTTRTWLKRAAWFLPLALEGVRLARRTHQEPAAD